MYYTSISHEGCYFEYFDQIGTHIGLSDADVGSQYFLRDFKFLRCASGEINTAKAYYLIHQATVLEKFWYF